jgi:hypothetical protein
MIPFHLELPIQAATEVALAHGLVPDRCEILQDGNTLVLRLTESLVARVVTDRTGPRQGLDWFARENEVARHLTQHGAPVIPLHPGVPPEPHQHSGYAMNFWQFMTAIPTAPAPAEIGRTLFQCHEVLGTFPTHLPELAILRESLGLLRTLSEQQHFPAATLALLKFHLERSITALGAFPQQALHGDAHPGNLMNTAQGLLWTDWEDAFAGPVEWDLASIIWNAKILEGDESTAQQVLDAYCRAGGQIDMLALHHSMIGRAAVMSAWYPILYPVPSPERQAKLRLRLEWLQGLGSASAL